MDIISKDSFPPLGYDDAIRISLNHQSKLIDIRNEAHKIDLNNFKSSELKRFVKYCLEKTK